MFFSGLQLRKHQLALTQSDAGSSLPDLAVADNNDGLVFLRLYVREGTRPNTMFALLLFFSGFCSPLFRGLSNLFFR